MNRRFGSCGEATISGRVNGQEVSEKEELIEAVSHCGGEEVVLDLDRDGELIQVKLEPVRTQEGDYKLGVWVRDNTQESVR